MTNIAVGVVDTALIVIYVVIAMRKMVLVSGSADVGDASIIVDEHRRDLRGAVRVYRWIGVAMTVALAVTAGAALWELVSTGISPVFAGLAVYTGGLSYLVRIIFRRVDMYEQMYKDTLPKVRDTFPAALPTENP